MSQPTVRTFLLSAVALSCLAAFVAGTLVTPPYDPLPFDPFWLVWAGFPVVGAVILIKRPGNHVGLLQVLIGVSAALSALTSVLYELGANPTAPVLVNQLAFTPIFVLVPLLILVFPSGHLPSERWIPFVRAAVGLTTLLAIWLAIRPVEYSIDNVDFYANPLGVEVLATFDPWIMNLLQWALIAFAVATIVSAIARYRRADAIGRLQVKWVIVPTLFMPVLFALAVGVELVDPELTHVSNVLSMIALLFGANGIAAGIGVAVTRHRLYGIDKIVSRTVTYAVLVALLALAFFGLVTGLTTFVTSDEPLVIAVATLAVAAMFNPLRQRVLRWVNRRFNRSTVQAELVVENFADTLRDSVDPDAVVEGWVDVVEVTMQPAAVGVWVKTKTSP